MNLREGFDKGSDLSDMWEVRAFARHLLDSLRQKPDIVLLQEVNSRSAHYTARVLTSRTGNRYVVAQDAGRKAWWQESGRVYKADTAIVINNETMSETGRSGYITTTYDPAKGKTEYKKNARALIKERRGDMTVAVASVHLPPKGRYLERVKKITTTLEGVYGTSGPETYHVVGGDFNRTAISSTGTFGQYDNEAWWTWLTQAPRDYNDSIYHVRREKGVDYVFVKGGVLGAGLPARERSYSDHRFRWATIGPDPAPPTAPTGVATWSPKDSDKDLIRITWSPADDAEGGIFEYDVWRSKDGTNFTRLGSTALDAYYDYTVDRGAQYWYYVVAKDWSDNNGPASEVVTEVAGG
jgi:endonuclease/exonuclease/phosphatase family metal-dependent hydrolase